MMKAVFGANLLPKSEQIRISQSGNLVFLQVKERLTTLVFVTTSIISLNTYIFDTLKIYDLNSGVLFGTHSKE